MKIYMVSVAFAPARVAVACLQQVYKTIGIQVEHHMLTNHYPINHDRNERILKAAAEAYGATWHDQGVNLGLSGGYNYLLSQLNLQDSDIVIGLDLDVWPVDPGWGEALVKVASDPRTAWASLFNPHSQRELPERGYTIHTINGVVVYEPYQACVNSICAWPGWFLKSTGGLNEPNKWYGGLEVMSMPLVKKLGARWVYLPQFREFWNSAIEGDRCYVVYKWEYAHKKSTTLDFASWLKEDPSREDLK